MSVGRINCGSALVALALLASLGSAQACMPTSEAFADADMLEKREKAADWKTVEQRRARSAVSFQGRIVKAALVRRDVPFRALFKDTSHVNTFEYAIAEVEVTRVIKGSVPKTVVVSELVDDGVTGRCDPRTPLHGLGARQTVYEFNLGFSGQPLAPEPAVRYLDNVFPVVRY